MKVEWAVPSTLSPIGARVDLRAESEVVMERDNGEDGETQLSLFPAIVMPRFGLTLD